MEGYATQLSQTLTENDIDALLATLDKTTLVSVTDSKGLIIYANEKFREVSQYSLEELLGQNHRILKSGHQPDELFTDLWKTISSGKMWRGEIKNKAKDGSYYWVDSSIAPIFDDEGNIERYVSIRLLITDRKKLEEELSEKIRVLEVMNETMVGRELKMIELKERIKKCEDSACNKE